MMPRPAGEVRRRAGQAVRAAAGRRRACASWSTARRSSRSPSVMPCRRLSRLRPRMPSSSIRSGRAVAASATAAQDRIEAGRLLSGPRCGVCRPRQQGRQLAHRCRPSWTTSERRTCRRSRSCSVRRRDTRRLGRGRRSHASPIGRLDDRRARWHTPVPRTPRPRRRPADGGNVILDAFNALLAMEQGEPRPAVRAQAAAGAPAVDHRRARRRGRRAASLERLAPNAARDLVRQIVADVAERSDPRGNRAHQSGGEHQALKEHW